MTPPYLTERATANEQAMLAKAREIIGAAKHPASDSDLVSTIGDFRSHAWKAIGAAVSPQLDVRDETYLDVWREIERAGAFSADEMSMFERELPRLRGAVATAYPFAAVCAMPPADIRAHAFAQFANGRNEEGMEGGHLHVGARRAFERCYEMMQGLQALANRMGFYKASDLFRGAYAHGSARGRSPIQELRPNEPGEATPVARNKNKRTTK